MTCALGTISVGKRKWLVVGSWLVAQLLVVLCQIGCGPSQAEVKKANAAAYQADFAVVYGEVLAATLRWYPYTEEDATRGVIETRWHPIRVKTGTGKDSSRNSMGAGQSGTGTGLTQGGFGQLTTTAPSDQRQYYIRFRIVVTGGSPWRVRIESEASEWRAGDVPMPLRGAEVPHWLEGRTQALRLEIHRRLKKYAVFVDPEKVDGTPAKQRETDVFGNLPDAAALVVREVLGFAKERDFAKLRTRMAEDLVWEVGNPGNADVALTLVQADSSLLTQLAEALQTGCIPLDKTVQCDSKGTPARRALFARREGTWVLTGFFAVP